jgi:hypothetical protein
LENRDALERYSGATFGYHQTLPTSVAANASYQEIGFESFEDYGANNTWMCNDRKFKLNDFDTPNPVGEMSSDKSHTGRYSLKVVGTLKKKYNVPEPCEEINCNLQVSAQYNYVNYSATIQITGGHQPYSLEWLIISGNPQIQVNALQSGTQVSVAANSGWSIQLTITDSSGNSNNQFIQL